MTDSTTSTPTPNRRDFLKTTAALAGATMPYWFTTPSQLAQGFHLVNNRPVLGCIATGDRWHGLIDAALEFADGVAVSDADKSHMERGRDKVRDIQGRKGKDAAVEMYEDYRKLLDRKDIDVVTIVSPDHWHTKMAIDAMRAGKDVYCEKPLTLTIREGQQIIKVLKETKRVFQVGTQQRSNDFGVNFLKSVAMIKQGRIGKLTRVTADIGGAPVANDIPIADVPAELNWDLWLGQAPVVKYRSRPSGGHYPHSRTHYEFRWWYEYSGGKMTDWGAHHVDIASWAIGIDKSGPLTVQGVAEHPCEYKNGYPQRDDCYNTAHKFDVTVMCPGDVEMHIVSDSADGNGILFEGTEGRFHVNRSRMKGRPVDDLASNPISDEELVKLYKGKEPTSHMRNFFQCVADRSEPISDVFSHHRAMTTCHLANIAIRLGRKLTWDSVKEQIVNDPEANKWLEREQRKGYEIDVKV